MGGHPFFAVWPIGAADGWRARAQNGGAPVRRDTYRSLRLTPDGNWPDLATGPNRHSCQSLQSAQHCLTDCFGRSLTQSVADRSDTGHTHVCLCRWGQRGDSSSRTDTDHLNYSLSSYIYNKSFILCKILYEITYMCYKCRQALCMHWKSSMLKNNI